MELYRFSPIKSEHELLRAIEYTHFACFDLLKRNFGRYLPSAGNIGIFCHYDDEYIFLTNLRKKLTEESNNWNQKYYRLHKPLIMEAKGDVPETAYTHLYIRGPDQHKEVGDVDFVLGKEEYNKLKQELAEGKEMDGLEILDRPDLDLIRLFDPKVDVLSFIGTKDMSDNLITK